MISFIIWLALGLLVTSTNDVFTRFNFPQAAVVIILGFIIGPYYFGVISFGVWEERITEFVVIFILFSAGFEIKWSHFINAIKPGILVGLTGVILSIFFGFAVSYSFSGLMEEALYISIALAATSIGISVPLLLHEKLLSSRVGQILLAAAIVDDILVLYLLSAAHLGLTTDSGIFEVINALIVSFIFLTLICMVVWCCQWLFFKIQISKLVFPRRFAILSLAFVSAWFTHFIGLSPAVGGFAGGAILALGRNSFHKQDSDTMDKISNLLMPLFFLSIGMRIIELDFSDPEIMTLSMLVVLAAIAGKFFSPWVLTSILSKKERALLGMALVPRAEVALVVASTGLDQRHLSHHGMVAIVMMTLVTAILASSTIPRLAERVRL